MESAGLRRREQHDNSLITEAVEAEEIMLEDDEGLRPPRYFIDLSLPPIQRYRHVAADFKPQAAALPQLFDEIVRENVPNISVSKGRLLARLMLRRVYTNEETEELRGISEVIGIDMWLLVAFNVLLDLFMGCTSGGVKIDKTSGTTTMLHFRTLDWGMSSLRKVIVQLDFVGRPGGEILATSITYVGFVGMITAVKKGLSMSLNFRPNHDASNRLANFRFYSHHLLVLLGLRQSIPSLLRQQLLPSSQSSTYSDMEIPTLDTIEHKLPSMTTTAAYLVFSDGNRCLTMEKDHHTAIIRSSAEFIVSTNHDAVDESQLPPKNADALPGSKNPQSSVMDLLDGLEDSVDRKRLATNLWKSSTRSKRNQSQKFKRNSRFPCQDDVVRWMGTFPIVNELTHFAAIMDPRAGSMVWIKRYLEPFEQAWQIT